LSRYPIFYEFGAVLGTCYYETFIRDKIMVHPRVPNRGGPRIPSSVPIPTGLEPIYDHLSPVDIQVLEDTVRAFTPVPPVNYQGCITDICTPQGPSGDDLAINLQLPAEDSEEDDSWFLSSDRQPANPEMIKSMEKSAEAARAEAEMMRAQADLERERRAQVTARWTSGRIEHMVATYGEIDTFTGLTDLTEEQIEHLKTILNTTPLDVMKKNKRAAELVKKWITPQEWAQLLKEHIVVIKSKKYKNRSYVVSEDPSARVKILEKGELKGLVCGVDADSSYAAGDKVLNKIISLKEDEDYYLNNSNVSRY
jgi:hypothetical protein